MTSGRVVSIHPPTHGAPKGHIGSIDPHQRAATIAGVTRLMLDDAHKALVLIASGITPDLTLLTSVADAKAIAEAALAKVDIAALDAMHADMEALR